MYVRKLSELRFLEASFFCITKKQTDGKRQPIQELLGSYFTLYRAFRMHFYCLI